MITEFDYSGFEEYLVEKLKRRWETEYYHYFFEFENGYLVEVTPSPFDFVCWSVNIFPRGSYLTVYTGSDWELDIAPYVESMEGFAWYHEVPGDKVKDILQIAKDIEVKE